MSFYQSALRLSKMGFHVFPLLPNSKLPAIDDFPNRATTDPEQIRKWWICPVLGTEQPYNIGISTSKFNGGECALVVLDIDNKGKKNGSFELERLKKEGFDFPPTATQLTPSGGLHMIYRSKTAVGQGVDKLAPGIDVRSRGGYIVGVGSVIDGREYKWK